ncbi:MAG TPA: AMP-binding protein [Iamia sp.]|nr:AMP-binding protein [Iamia sp.]
MLLLDLVLGAGSDRAHDDDPALVAPDVTVTRGELRAEVEAIAGAVADVVAPGGRVAIAADNRVAVVALLLAIPAAGRIAVPLNTRLTADDMLAQMAAAGAEVLVGSADELGRVGMAGEQWAGPQTTVGLDHGVGDISLAALTAAPGSTARELPVPADDDPAWIIFTSGTTGRAKGAVLTAHSLGAAVATTAAARPLADDDVYLYPFPLYHVSAYNILHALHRGRPTVLPRRFEAAAVAELAAAHRVTVMSLAPTMLRLLLDHVAREGADDLASLRSVSYGAAPLAPALLAEAAGVLGVDFAQGYGMTELSGNAVFLGPDDHRRGLVGEERLLRAAGRAGPGVELRIVGDDGTEVATGTAGEVCVRAAQVCAGYWEDPEATAAALRDGWLHTGDVGTLDDDGLLTIVDRAKDIIITGGENVASREVEDAIAHHPAVARVAVIGVPDERWGEAIVAVVVLRDDEQAGPATIDAIIAEAGRRLARFKVPKRIELVDDLPVNAGGKVDKVDLRRRFG